MKPTRSSPESNDTRLYAYSQAGWNRVSIEAGPAMVGHWSRIGDWESETLIGRHHRGVLVSLVERKSGYTCWRNLCISFDA